MTWLRRRNGVLEEALNAAQIRNGRFENTLLSLLVGERKEVKRLVGLLHVGFYASWEMRRETGFLGKKVVDGMRKKIRFFRIHLLLQPLHTLLGLIDPFV